MAFYAPTAIKVRMIGSRAFGCIYGFVDQSSRSRYMWNHVRDVYIGGCGLQSTLHFSTLLSYEHPENRTEVRAQVTERSRRLVGAPDLHAILAEIGL